MSIDFAKLLKAADNDYASIVEEDEFTNVNRYVDTGSYTLNALLSGSIYGGLAGNKVTALAGEPATGKTFYAINIVKQFLIDNPTGFAFYFETESSVTKDQLETRGVDISRTALIPVMTVQEFRTQAVKILDAYMENKNYLDNPIIMVLDSLGNLSTAKEMEDIAKGADTRDMTRSQLIKGAFRTIMLKLGRAQVPLIVTNHVYDVIGSYIPTKKMAGGSGLEYAASQIVFLSKKKDRDTTTKEVMGSIVTGRLKKSRLTIEDKKVETLLDYKSGLNRYYGLVDLAIKFGIFKKGAKQIELEDGTKVFEKAINRNPEKYFTKEILDKIDEACKQEFLYGQTTLTDEVEDEGDE